MLIKQFTEMHDPKIWELAEHEDIIITLEGSSEQRVLINFKTYEAMKKALFRMQKQLALANDETTDWNLHLQDFKDILNHNQFKEVEQNYFEKLAQR